MSRIATLVVCSLLSATNMASETALSWAQPHSTVLSHGDLKWAPEPFVYLKGESVRYIDFENGNDNSDGMSKDTPWKHHPWDKNAGEIAAKASGAITYVFKQGVVYRGILVAKESGAPGNPIRLTRDPSWGQGEAAIYGSRQITGGWKRATTGDVPPHMPEPEMVWYIDIDTKTTPDGVWVVSGDKAQRVEIARHPNWTVSNRDDPQLEWLPWEESHKGIHTHTGVFQGKPEGFFKGGSVWSEWNGNMGTVFKSQMKSINSKAGTVSIYGQIAKGNRFFIENVPGFLDAPGEFYHATDGNHAGRLYMRMPGDMDPNAAVIEVAQNSTLISAVDKSHIHISGLRFSFNNTPGWRSTFYPGVVDKATTLRFLGDMRDIVVRNSTFHHVTGVIVAYPRGDQFTVDTYDKSLKPWKIDVAEDIAITDNDISYSSVTGTISLSDGPTIFHAVDGQRGRLGEVRVLRNRISWSGFRQGNNALSNIASIEVIRPTLGEIAGNFIDMSWGSGIFTFSGNKDKYIGQDSPLTRVFIHHNKLTNAMLATNDWGGIAYWQGGPIYTYNNIAGNVIGYKSSTAMSSDYKTVAYNYYLDGTFKSYTFNNIAWGKYNQTTDQYRSRGPYFVVLGYMNHCFNNSFYKFRHGILGSSGNRSTFLGNVISNITGDFIQQNRPGDTSLRGGGDTGDQGNRGMPTNAYGFNVFFGNNRVGNAGPVRGGSVEEWQKGLIGLNARLSQTGWKVKGEAFTNPDPLDTHDFRLKDDSPARDRGVRFFVPFGLYKMVGEWNFIHHPGNETLIVGEHFYMDDSFVHRHMYEDVPRNNLTIPGAVADDYIDGPLEDWQKGALRFDGISRFAMLPHQNIVGSFNYKWPLTSKGRNQKTETEKGAGVYDKPRDNLDFDNNNFLIEAYLRTDGKGAIVSKMDGNGYELAINAAGNLEIIANGARAQSRVSINDGKWRHIIAEVDRLDKTARFYIDGKLDSESAIAIDGSLANTGDFYVGKGGSGLLRMDLDFLRLSRGTLADARTTIGELHAWQFDGPFLHDWTGRKPADGKRDAGAIDLAR